MHAIILPYVILFLKVFDFGQPLINMFTLIGCPQQTSQRGCAIFELFLLYYMNYYSEAINIFVLDYVNRNVTFKGVYYRATNEHTYWDSKKNNYSIRICYIINEYINVTNFAL